MSRLLITEVSPHINDKTTTQKIMLDVLIALIPTSIAAVVLFGERALLIIGVCVVSCVLFEFLFEKICKMRNTVTDLSAAVTGLLLALNMPVNIPIWQAVFGSAAAIIVVKQLFGGIGKNFANPAITARLIMLLSFPSVMSTWTLPNGVDAVSSATPLEVMSGVSQGELPSLLQMLFGLRGGSIGETCAVAIIIGGIYLLVRKVISWHTPVAFIVTVFVFTWILGKQPVYQILSGGLLLGAVFMATDYATTPYTKSGKLIFGVCCGLLTVMIRVWGSYPEGVSFAILLMNIVTPYINKLTHSKPFGGVKAA